MNFQEAVIERSQEVPVVVDFWASWCGPCRVLGPVIEGLAAESNGRWELVKINTEEEREIATQFNIMSIPAVKMFVNGEVVAEFNGALPKSQIQQWLDTHIPDDRVAVLNELVQQLKSGINDTAKKALAVFVEENPDLIEARIFLAKEMLSEDPQKSLELIGEINEAHKYADEAVDIRALVELMEGDFSQEDALSGKLSEAQSAMGIKDFEVAIQRLIEAIMINKAFRDELPRRAIVAIFRWLGNDHPMTKQYRPQFSMALY